MLLFFRLDPSSALDFLWACSHIPRIWQGRDQKIRQVRYKIPRGVTLFSAFDEIEFIGGSLHSAEADSCACLFVRTEENREVRVATQLGGAHQPGGPDLVRVGAQQSRLSP